MIDRRSLLLAGVALGTGWGIPASARPSVNTPLAEFNLIDLNVWTGGSSIRARSQIERGRFLLPAHLHHIGKVRRLTAALSPANAVLLAEYVRFDRGVIIEEYAPRAALAWLRADARTMMVRWTS